MSEGVGTGGEEGVVDSSLLNLSTVVLALVTVALYFYFLRPTTTEATAATNDTTGHEGTPPATPRSRTTPRTRTTPNKASNRSMMDPNDTDGSSFPTFTFVLPGRPLLLASNSKALTRARTQLQELVTARNAGDYFPIPATIPIALEATFHYPATMQGRPGIMDLYTISREITIGIMYVDNNSIHDKSIRMRVATPDSDNPEGSTSFRITPMV